MKHPETTGRRDGPQTTEKNFVGMGEQANFSAASDRNRSDIADARKELEAKAAMIENSIAAVLAYDTEDRLLYCNQAGFRLNEWGRQLIRGVVTLPYRYKVK